MNMSISECVVAPSPVVTSIDTEGQSESLRIQENIYHFVYDNLLSGDGLLSVPRVVSHSCWWKRPVGEIRFVCPSATFYAEPNNCNKQQNCCYVIL